jgi:hypothetical protein
MKKRCLFAVVIVVLASCQKEAGNAPPLPGESLKLKTYTEDVTSAFYGNSVTTYNISYDGSDRLTGMADAGNPGNKFVFAYPTASKYSLDLFVSNVFELHVDYLLNGLKLVDSSFQYNNTGDTMSEKYIYNPSMQVSTLLQYDYSSVYGPSLEVTTHYTYDGAGNLVKSEDSDQYVTTYEYYSDKIYLMPQVIPMAVPNKKANLPKKMTIAESGTVQASVDYTYTFDSKDRISTVREEYSDGDVVVKTYTYFD